MLRLTILSPHRDDAAFSLFCALTKWRRLPVEIKVINFFTESAYAPHAKPPVASASALRKREDRAVLYRIGRGIRVVDEGMLDAPLRLGIDALTVCNPETAALLRRELVCELVEHVRSQHPSLILAPLGLGGHIDHLAVHAAALRSPIGPRLGFYEELPYRMWTSPEALRCRVESAETELRIQLRPFVVREHSAVFQKRRAIARYRSQITPQEALEIARWTREQRGERLWLPEQSSCWRRPARSALSPAIAPQRRAIVRRSTD